MVSAGPSGAGEGRGIKMWEVKVWDSNERHWVKRFPDRDLAWEYYDKCRINGFDPMIPLPTN